MTVSHHRVLFVYRTDRQSRTPFTRTLSKTVSHLTFRVQDRQAEQDSLRGRVQRQYPTFLFVYWTDRQSRTPSTRTHSKTVSHHLPFRVQDRQAEQDSLYEDAFDKMKRAAGVSNIDEVVQR